MSEASMPDALGDGVHVLVAAAGEVDQQDRVLPIDGAIFIACATACADSSAGMMPSVRHSSWNAASASSSVTATYSARLLSFSQACSGPTPG